MFWGSLGTLQKTPRVKLGASLLCTQKFNRPIYPLSYDGGNAVAPALPVWACYAQSYLGQAAFAFFSVATHREVQANPHVVSRAQGILPSRQPGRAAPLPIPSFSSGPAGKGQVSS